MCIQDILEPDGLPNKTHCANLIFHKVGNNVLRTVIERGLKDHADGRAKVRPEDLRRLSKTYEILNRQACKEEFATKGVANKELGNFSDLSNIRALLSLKDIL